MKTMRNSILAIAGLAALPAWAQETNGCPAGSYSIVVSPDGSSLSLLFDRFTLESGAGSGSASQRKVCRISAPLNLPANQSIGVYKVDYRGFAKLGAKQETSLDVQYFLGPQAAGRGRVFKRKVKGPHEGDYVFTENIGAGQMKRVGCGAAAVLNMGITLTLDGALQPGPALSTLDTMDGTRGASLVYHFDLNKC